MFRHILRKKIHFFLVRRKGVLFGRRNDGTNFLIFSFLFLLTAMVMFNAASSQISPVIAALAEAKVKHIATVIATDVMNEKMEDIQYDDLIILQKDGTSRITAVQANIVRMNRISAEMASSMQERLGQMDDIYVKVPLGNIFGNSFLANRGPEFTAKVIPYGNIDIDFKTELISAGINQTRHRIYLEITSKLLVIVPFVKKDSKVVTKVPVAETVIIGDVPDSFINLEGMGRN